jgi:hypothetical protein
MDDDSAVNSFLNLKFEDKVKLKIKKYLIDSEFSIDNLSEIEVVLPFKIEGFNSIDDFHTKGYFMGGFDCYHIIDF